MTMTDADAQTLREIAEREDAVVQAARNLSDIMAEFSDDPEIWGEPIAEMDAALDALDRALAASQEQRRG